MMLTSKARYAVMAMVDLTLHADCGPVRLSEISERQEITTAYLEQIFAKLKKNGLVQAVRGPGGGYKLAKAPEQIAVADILTAVGEQLKMTRCNHDPRAGCMQAKTRCVTHDLWAGLSRSIYTYLRNISLKEVCANTGSGKACGALDFSVPNAANEMHP